VAAAAAAAQEIASGDALRAGLRTPALSLLVGIPVRMAVFSST
jgi:hypothetical protein